MKLPRAFVVVPFLALALALVVAASASADTLINETFTGATVNDPTFTTGGTGFTGCLTASTNTTQTPVPGCAAGSPALPAGGDTPGAGVLRLTSNANNESGFVLYNKALPLTEGVQATFDFFTYDGSGGTGADGLSFFMVNGNTSLTSTGATGGSLGYAQKDVAPIANGIAGGYLGLGLDEYGNYSNPTEGRNDGCPASTLGGFKPQSVALRGPGSGQTGYCLLATSPVAQYGGVSDSAATTRTTTGVERSAMLTVDPPGEAGAAVTLYIDFHDGDGYRQVFQAPLPADPPATFKFGFAASTGASTNVHEIRFVDINTIEPLPQLTLTKTHTGSPVAGEVTNFQLQATVAAAGGAEQNPVTITDPLPAGDVVSALPSGTGWDCSQTTVGSGTATCTYAASAQAPIAPGTTLPALTVPVQIDPSHLGSYTNTATASSTDNSNTPAQSSASDTYNVTQRADLQIVKTPSTSTDAVGNPLTYTLAVTNDGPSDATDVTVTDPLPGTLTVDSVTPQQGACSGGPAISCTLGAVAAGTTVDVQVVATPLAVAAGTAVANTATVTADQPDPNPSNNSSTATIHVPGADLQIVKTPDPKNGTAGTAETYTLVVKNNGPDTAANVVMSDPLPSGETFVSASAGCSFAAGTVSCTLASLADGASHTFTVDTKIDSSTTTAQVNTASVTSNTADPSPSNNTSTARVPVGADADLAVTKTSSAGTVPINGQVSYTLVVSDRGPSDATGVTVSDPVPTVLTVVAVSPSQGTCTDTVAAGISCGLGTIVDGGQAQILVTATVDPSAGDSTILNTAKVTGNQPDPDPSNNGSTAKVTVPPSADVNVVKTASTDTIVPGTDLTYTLRVANSGPNTAQNVTVADPLPAGETLVSASPDCTIAAATVTCAVGSVPAGATTMITLTVAVAPSVTSGLTNVATVSSPTPDPNPSNNTSTVSAGVGPETDLSITKTASATTVAVGSKVTYTLVAANNGPADATDVTVVDPLPPSVTAVSASPSAGSCSVTDGRVSCDLGALAPGASARVTIIATVTAKAQAGTTISNAATVAGAQPDDNQSNNTGTATVRVASSDVSIVKHVDRRRAYPGQLLNYTLTVTNPGPDPATGVKITDTASLELQIVSVQPSSGRCTVGPPLTCSLGTIAPGGHVTIRVTARATRSGALVNVATMTSTSTDSNPRTNISRARTAIVPILTLVKTASRKVVSAGQSVTYHLKVTNPTSVTVKRVTVCDALPTELLYVSSSPRAFRSAGRYCWMIAGLGANRSNLLSLTVSAEPSRGANVTNRATATAPGVRGARAHAMVRIRPAPRIGPGS